MFGNLYNAIGNVFERGRPIPEDTEESKVTIEQSKGGGDDFVSVGSFDSTQGNALAEGLLQVHVSPEGSPHELSDLDTPHSPDTEEGSVAAVYASVEAFHSAHSGSIATDSIAASSNTFAIDDSGAFSSTGSSNLGPLTSVNSAFFANSPAGISADRPSLLPDGRLSAIVERGPSARSSARPTVSPNQTPTSRAISTPRASGGANPIPGGGGAGRSTIRGGGAFPIIASRVAWDKYDWKIGRKLSENEKRKLLRKRALRQRQEAAKATYVGMSASQHLDDESFVLNLHMTYMYQILQFLPKTADLRPRCSKNFWDCVSLARDPIIYPLKNLVKKGDDPLRQFFQFWRKRYQPEYHISNRFHIDLVAFLVYASEMGLLTGNKVNTACGCQETSATFEAAIDAANRRCREKFLSLKGRFQEVAHEKPLKLRRMENRLITLQKQIQKELAAEFERREEYLRIWTKTRHAEAQGKVQRPVNPFIEWDETGAGNQTLFFTSSNQPNEARPSGNAVRTSNIMSNSGTTVSSNSGPSFGAFDANKQISFGQSDTRVVSLDMKDKRISSRILGESEIGMGLERVGSPLLIQQSESASGGSSAIGDVRNRVSLSPTEGTKADEDADVPGEPAALVEESSSGSKQPQKSSSSNSLNDLPDENPREERALASLEEQTSAGLGKAAGPRDSAAEAGNRTEGNPPLAAKSPSSMMNSPNPSDRISGFRSTTRSVLQSSVDVGSSLARSVDDRGSDENSPNASEYSSRKPMQKAVFNRNKKEKKWKHNEAHPLFMEFFMQVLELIARHDFRIVTQNEWWRRQNAMASLAADDISSVIPVGEESQEVTRPCQGMAMGVKFIYPIPPAKLTIAEMLEEWATSGGQAAAEMMEATDTDKSRIERWYKAFCNRMAMGPTMTIDRIQCITMFLQRQLDLHETGFDVQELFGSVELTELADRLEYNTRFYGFHLLYYIFFTNSWYLNRLHLDHESGMGRILNYLFRKIQRIHRDFSIWLDARTVLDSRMHVGNLDAAWNFYNKLEPTCITTDGVKEQFVELLSAQNTRPHLEAANLMDRDVRMVGIERLVLDQEIQLREVLNDYVHKALILSELQDWVTCDGINTLREICFYLEKQLLKDKYKARDKRIRYRPTLTQKPREKGSSRKGSRQASAHRNVSMARVGAAKTFQSNALNVGGLQKEQDRPSPRDRPSAANAESRKSAANTESRESAAERASRSSRSSRASTTVTGTFGHDRPSALPAIAEEGHSDEDSEDDKSKKSDRRSRKKNDTARFSRSPNSAFAIEQEPSESLGSSTSGSSESSDESGQDSYLERMNQNITCTVFLQEGQKLGSSFPANDAMDRFYFPLKVKDVAPGSIADQTGVEPDFILSRINGVATEKVLLREEDVPAGAETKRVYMVRKLIKHQKVVNKYVPAYNLGKVLSQRPLALTFEGQSLTDVALTKHVYFKLQAIRNLAKNFEIVSSSHQKAQRRALRIRLNTEHRRMNAIDKEKKRREQGLSDPKRWDAIDDKFRTVDGGEIHVEEEGVVLDERRNPHGSGFQVAATTSATGDAALGDDPGDLNADELFGSVVENDLLEELLSSDDNDENEATKKKREDTAPLEAISYTNPNNVMFGTGVRSEGELSSDQEYNKKPAAYNVERLRSAFFQRHPTMPEIRCVHIECVTFELEPTAAFHIRNMILEIPLSMTLQEIRTLLEALLHKKRVVSNYFFLETGTHARQARADISVGYFRKYGQLSALDPQVEAFWEDPEVHEGPWLPTVDSILDELLPNRTIQPVIGRYRNKHMLYTLNDCRGERSIAPSSPFSQKARLSGMDSVLNAQLSEMERQGSLLNRLAEAELDMQNRSGTATAAARSSMGTAAMDGSLSQKRLQLNDGRGRLDTEARLMQVADILEETRDDTPEDRFRRLKIAGLLRKNPRKLSPYTRDKLLHSSPEEIRQWAVEQDLALFEDYPRDAADRSLSSSTQQSLAKILSQQSRSRAGSADKEQWFKTQDSTGGLASLQSAALVRLQSAVEPEHRQFMAQNVFRNMLREKGLKPLVVMNPLARSGLEKLQRSVMRLRALNYKLEDFRETRFAPAMAFKDILLTPQNRGSYDFHPAFRSAQEKMWNAVRKLRAVNYVLYTWKDTRFNFPPDSFRRWRSKPVKIERYYAREGLKKMKNALEKLKAFNFELTSDNMRVIEVHKQRTEKAKWEMREAFCKNGMLPDQWEQFITLEDFLEGSVMDNVPKNDFHWLVFAPKPGAGKGGM